jgi:hypothetical protein
MVGLVEIKVMRVFKEGESLATGDCAAENQLGSDPEKLEAKAFILHQLIQVPQKLLLIMNSKLQC